MNHMKIFCQDKRLRAEIETCHLNVKQKHKGQNCASVETQPSLVIIGTCKLVAIFKGKNVCIILYTFGKSTAS
jgi:hypothetical protein